MEVAGEGDLEKDVVMKEEANSEVVKKEAKEDDMESVQKRRIDRIKREVKLW